MFPTQPKRIVVILFAPGLGGNHVMNMMSLCDQALPLFEHDVDTTHQGMPCPAEPNYAKAMLYRYRNLMGNAVHFSRQQNVEYRDLVNNATLFESTNQAVLLCAHYSSYRSILDMTWPWLVPTDVVIMSDIRNEPDSTIKRRWLKHFADNLENMPPHYSMNNPPPDHQNLYTPEDLVNLYNPKVTLKAPPQQIMMWDTLAIWSPSGASYIRNQTRKLLGWQLDASMDRMHDLYIQRMTVQNSSNNTLVEVTPEPTPIITPVVETVQDDSRSLLRRAKP